MEYNLLAVGIVLLIAEIFIPSFGILGIAGLLALTIGCFYLLGAGMQAVLILLAVYGFIGLVIVVLGCYFPKESKWNPFVLWEKQKNEQGYTGSSDFSAYLNKVGLAITPLRPAGTIEIEGQRLDVSSLGDYIDKDMQVKVIKVEGNKIFVKKV